MLLLLLLVVKVIGIMVKLEASIVVITGCWVMCVSRASLVKTPGAAPSTTKHLDGAAVDVGQQQ